MNTRLAALASAVVGLLAAGLVALAVPAAATESPEVGCPGVQGWYVNGDEMTRKPTPGVNGFTFSGPDLIHHTVSGVTVDNLAPGEFVAAPAPDQPSFFSVEVVDVDGSGYGTLRWNTETEKWNLVTGGTFYEDEDPAVLVTLPPVDRSHRVVSFGVGYTLNPPGTVETVVSSVKFNGVTYSLRCAPASSSSSASASASTSTSASASASTSASASASSSASSSASPSTTGSASSSASPSTTTSTTAAPGITTTPVAGGGSLPVTGPGGGTIMLAGAALAVIGTGGLLFVLARRRKVSFEG